MTEHREKNVLLGGVKYARDFVIYAVLFVSVQRRWEKQEIRQKFGEENSYKVLTRMVSKKMDIKNTQKVDDAEDSWKLHFFHFHNTRLCLECL